MTQDEIIEIYIEVSNKLCNGTEWCWAGVGEPLQLFAKLVAEKAIKEALAEPEQDSTYTYASSLATAIWQKHYIKESPKFALLDTTEGVLTQIDNMTCGLVREKPAQPEPDPVAWEQFYPDIGKPQIAINSETVGYVAPQRTWVGLTDEEIEKGRDQTFSINNPYCPCDSKTMRKAVRWAEAKLKKKNTRGKE